jgi:hypothetical protein
MNFSPLQEKKITTQYAVSSEKEEDLAPKCTNFTTQRADGTERPYRVALHQRYDTLDPGIHGGAPRLGELGVLRGAVREALREQTVRAHRAEDGGELHRRELGAAWLRQALGDHRAEQPRLQPRVVDAGQEASARAGHRGPWYGGFGPAAGLVRDVECGGEGV